MTVAPTATWHARVPCRSCATCPMISLVPHLVKLDLSSDPIAQNLKSHFRAALAGSLLQGHKSHTPCDVMLYILLQVSSSALLINNFVLQGGSNSDSIRPHCVAPVLGPDSTCQSCPHTPLIKCPSASSRLNATGCHGRRTSSLR